MLYSLGEGTRFSHKRLVMVVVMKKLFFLEFEKAFSRLNAAFIRLQLIGLSARHLDQHLIRQLIVL